MRVAVIGGAGYIGCHVVLGLQDAGHEVVIFDNFSNGQEVNAFAPYTKGDILSFGELHDFLSSNPCDAIVHLAARKAAGESMIKPEIYSETNIQGAINVLNAAIAHGIKKFVFSSTAAVYGIPQYTPMDENHPLLPENFYGHTKLVVERILGWYGKLHGLHYAALRYFNAAGYDVQGRVKSPENGVANLFPVLFDVASGKRDKLSILGTDYDTRDGTCVRDYIHVTDLARAHVLSLEKLEHNQQIIVNVGSEQGFTVQECVDAARELIGDFTVERAPRRPGDPGVLLANASKAKEVLGWHAEHSDLKTIISTMAPLYGLPLK